jgi:mannan endo-1,4-beta-mannosidase
VTPDASPEARQLLLTLNRYFGKKILTGQQDEHGPRLDYIAQHTGGKGPAILGLDLLNYSGAYDRPDGQIERARDWALKTKGIVTLSWHWFSPFGAKDIVWKSFNAKETTFDASRIGDESSPEYAAIVRDIDLVAGQLKILRDAHVPVLWRPLHEAEGAWFWWGAFGPEVTKRLYRLMFDRFTRIHGLNNLIWVWTTTDNPNARTWYPGDDVVDIVGADIYAPAGTQGTFLSVFDNLRQLYGGRKAIALCETGTVPVPDDLERDGADWLWFLVWDDYISRPEINSVDRIARAYQSSEAVVLVRPGQVSVPSKSP